MIKVYTLPVEVVDGTEQVAGISAIHDAILLVTEDPAKRLLIMDTTVDEHSFFNAFAVEVRDPSQQELDLFNETVIPYEPSPDDIRACEILSQSPDVITQPEIWELLRIFGRRFGYPFD